MATLVQAPKSATALRHTAPASLWLPRSSLSTCVRAIVARSTVGIGGNWPDAWHYNHFPASPLFSFGWYFAGYSELLDEGLPPAPGSPGRRLPQAYIGGPFTRPTLSRNSPEGHGLILMLQPDAMQALVGLSPAAWVNRIEPLERVLDADWRAFSDSVLAAPNDETRVALIEAFLEPRWKAVRQQAGPSGLLLLHDWLQGLSVRAAASGVGRSLRQAERRIKGWTGLPMRELRGFGRAERAFFRTLAEGDGPVRWTDIAADAGFADQSHLCRETRRVTGFAPTELRRRIAEDESFWIYRIWA